MRGVNRTFAKCVYTALILCSITDVLGDPTRSSQLGWVTSLCPGASVFRAQFPAAISHSTKSRILRWTARRRRQCSLPIVAMDQEDNGESGRDDAMQEKLKRWREQAEAVRLQDPSSPVSRAAATNLPRSFGGGSKGSRTDALRRMWNLKEIERRADIADEIETMRQSENPGLAADRQEAKAAADANLYEFVANLPPSKSLEELEALAMERRSLASINEKLARWREESRAAQEADVGRALLVVLFGALNQVAKLLGLLTGTRAELDDLEPIRLQPRPRSPVVSPSPPEKVAPARRGAECVEERLTGRAQDMAELLGRLRRRWEEAEPSAAPSLAEAQARMSELIAGDEGAEVKALLNSLLDTPDVYAALLGYGQLSPPTPLQLAAASGSVQAVEVLLRAGSATGDAAAAAAAAGHGEVAELIARAEQDRAAAQQQQQQPPPL